jgi:hypothetical protein
MKRISSVLLFGAIFLLAASPLHGLEESPQKPTRVGIGVPFGRKLVLIEDDEFIFQPTGFSNIYIPILLQSKFRLEPEFGLWRYSYSRDNGNESSSAYTSLRVGFGFFPLTQRGKVTLYYGLRLGITRTSSSWESDGDSDDASKTDFYIGPGFGGEYFFTDHLSLGGEAQMNYISVGQWSDEDADISRSVISNNTLVFLRWYY